MAKRFTDTDIWKKQRWFKKLKPDDKLAFMYIKDLCNHAGIWNIDCTDLMEDLGIENFVLAKFIIAVNSDFDKMTGKRLVKERLQIVKQNFLWITGFVQFQYENKEGKVNPEGAPVKTAFQILQGYGILKIAFDKGYITLTQPLLNPHVRLKDKDKDKDIVSTKKGITAKSKKTVPQPPTFNTMPKAAEFGALPEQYINISIELAHRLNHVIVEADTITSLWDVFKVQHLTGQNYYANDGKVYSHFVNIIKKEKFKTNGTDQNGVAKSVKSLLSKPSW